MGKIIVGLILIACGLVILVAGIVVALVRKNEKEEKGG